ncbi:MAG: Holliday junction branch migration DNA helicase RuvB [Oligoflexales bacterium]
MTQTDKPLLEYSKLKIERVVASDSIEDDSNVDTALRPTRFEDYPGQERAKSNLKVYIQAALKRSQSLDHIILHGPPGLGKTTLAKIIAHELGSSFYQTSGPSIDKPGDLAGILAGLEPKSVLFIDEIHRLSISVEEVLYSAMEDFNVDILVGQGPTARTIKMPLSPFTLIGATTRVSMLSRPLMSRFGIQERLEFYDVDSLMTILKRNAAIWDIPLSEEAARELARRSRGTPRIANRLLRRARDFADFEGQAELAKDLVEHTLARLDIDQMGLDRMDRKILEIIRDRYDGGPVGLETLAATIGEEKSTIEEVYEPFLMHQGFLTRGPRGRELSPMGRKHLEDTQF